MSLEILIPEDRIAARVKELAAQIRISETQLSLFRSGKVKGIRFATLARLCAALHCTPGDLLGYDDGPGDLLGEDDAGL